MNTPSTTRGAASNTTAAQRLPSTGLEDRRGRALRDLRISVTDRCNFRCVYCMPKEIFGRDYQFMERSELLTFEEITKVARTALSFGVTKLRLTGGEPLLRRGIEDLIAQLAELRALDGRKPDIALTTNGSALPVKAQALKEAGLDRVTVSLDSLDDAKFQAMNDVRFPVARVLDGIAAAQDAGLGPIKINTVVKRDTVDEILPLARHFRGTGNILRFIEYMDVGASNGWVLDEVVPSAEVVDIIGREHPLRPLEPNSMGETAQRWAYEDGEGEIGVISSVTRAFCGTCTRARISAEGKLYTCLFAESGYDLRALLRDGASDEQLKDALCGVWQRRDDRYSELRSGLLDGGKPTRKHIEMSYIGG
ncbi:GTP 3',8-cyclase MoaA [Gulosibacter molinativorax]|uniref:GTP 3',8-cyclase n=1 Tax=Gulosibacter molinativorax TaxID=256821 RepID=A0ABT7CB92_9MICO|nr:GTP 3',8-cyclase MoaA [Gulosibacter molinativorax]MDJ1372358.1 GTP 3',8-cyclase MoaA [Gulosibacter molinativorax]QUY63553.1 Cyclic pyranopterin monophosphate synthase [Gulosibacter molinativorax]